MNGSVRLATVAGIGVYIHWTFLVFLAWIFGAAILRGQGAAEGLQSAGYVLAIFACVVLHEFGHAFAARAFGIGTRDITLLPIGGVARLERMPEKPRQEIAVALAGPAVNVVIAAVLLAIVGVRGLVGSSPEQVVSAEKGDFLHSLMLVNVGLVLFNLIPAFPMDGGRVLRAGLALFMPYPSATRAAATVGQVVAVGFALLGLFGNPLMILIAVFVWLGAQAEAQHAEGRALIAGFPVSEAMVTDFKVLREDDTLEVALRQLLDGSQPDFPVLDGNRVVGVLPRDELLRAVAAKGTGALVGEVMRRDCAQVEDTDRLDRVVDRINESGCPLVPVLHHSELVGILTRENVAEFMMIRSALGRLRPPPPATVG